MTRKQQKSKKKTLRQVYMDDPAARAFLKKYPEFDNCILNENQKAHSYSKGSYRLTEPDKALEEQAFKIQDGLLLLKEGSAERRLLELYYYDNLSYEAIRVKMRYKTRDQVNSRLRRAKRIALKALAISNKQAQATVGSNSFVLDEGEVWDDNA
jgi:DNA-directed RNA polymerase specialized sigma24 family protein